MRQQKHSHKFMQVLNDAIWRQLYGVARRKGISIQELLRVIVIPEWLEQWREHHPVGHRRKTIKQR